VIPSPRMVAADHVGLDDLGYVMLHHEHVESKAGLPYPYDQDLSGVLLHLDVVSASRRAELGRWVPDSWAEKSYSVVEQISWRIGRRSCRHVRPRWA
jgi:hypothetical protein